MSLIPLDEVVHFDVITCHPSTAAAADADSTPTFDVYEEATDTGLLGATNLTKRTSLTGNYRGTFTASAANGFESGKWYNVIASATVNSIAGKGVAMRFRCTPAESVAGVPKVDASHIEGSDATDQINAAADAAISDAALATAANLATVAGYLDTEIAAILADTNELQTDWVDGGRLDAILDARASQASVSALNNLSAAQVNAEVVDALATDVIADSIPADGSRPTIAQALYLLTQFLTERSVSSTTLTVKKPDGSTTLATFTLDSASAPTSITRAS